LARLTVRPEFGNFVLVTAAFMILAMWIFPEAGRKEKIANDGNDAANGWPCR
jgi:hypothetical protein